MTLLLDIGNTRVKAGRATAGGVEAVGEAAYRETGLEAALEGLDLPPADRAVAALVAGGDAAAALARWAAGRGLVLERVRPRAEACGVRCGYPEPARLGADRWAALVGARGLTREACLVVDAGSAVTVDALDGDGRHLGGYIVPGLALMARALHRETGDLAAFSAASSAAPADEGGFPTDTRPAIEAGSVLAVAGLVRGARDRLGGSARVLLTGGDADVLGATLEEATRVPDLVLRGLARLAAEG